jgi:hypothetical protein
LDTSALAYFDLSAAYCQQAHQKSDSKTAALVFPSPHISGPKVVWHLPAAFLRQQLPLQMSDFYSLEVQAEEFVSCFQGEKR